MNASGLGRSAVMLASELLVAEDISRKTLRVTFSKASLRRRGKRKLPPHVKLRRLRFASPSAAACAAARPDPCRSPSGALSPPAELPGWSRAPRLSPGKREEDFCTNKATGSKKTTSRVFFSGPGHLQLFNAARCGAVHARLQPLHCSA